ncbi:MAG: hypothetical protein WDN46_22970 [Methylocella sp.]
MISDIIDGLGLRRHARHLRNWYAANKLLEADLTQAIQHRDEAHVEFMALKNRPGAKENMTPHTLTHLPSSLADVMTDITIQQGIVDEILCKLNGPSPLAGSSSNDKAEPVGLTELLHSQVSHIRSRLDHLTSSLYSLKSQIG